MAEWLDGEVGPPATEDSGCQPRDQILRVDGLGKDVKIMSPSVSIFQQIDRVRLTRE
jgi:hypothetical protein